MAIEREKALNWWVGRMTDAEIAEWAETTPRAVRLILDTPALHDHVKNRGKGSHAIRRVMPRARNAVPIVADLNRAGLSFELAANIIAVDPLLSEQLNETIDAVEPGDIKVFARSLDPNGGWLDNDMIPIRLWHRYVIHCREVCDPELKHGVYEIMSEDFVPNTNRGTMVKRMPPGGDRARRSLGLNPKLELVPVSDDLHYDGEYDVWGFYSPEAQYTAFMPAADDHLLIVDGCIVFHRYPAKRGRVSDDPPKLITRPVGKIQQDGKTIRPYRRLHLTEKEIEKLCRRTKFYKTLLDINITYSVRRMKRRALGLPVS